MMKTSPSKYNFYRCRSLLVALACTMIAFAFSVTQTLAQGTAFTYQGKLENGGSPANGNYDFQFTLKTALSGGITVSGTVTQTKTNVSVTNGTFTTELNFGSSAFDGGNRWLEIKVRSAGAGNYTTLSPRQKINSTPYATLAAGLPNVTVSGGNVGIGEEFPSRLLELTDAIPEIEFTESDESNKSWHIGPADGDFDLVETNLAVRMTIKAGGNIGIGTGNPTAKLEIVGTSGSQPSAYYYDDQNNAPGGYVGGELPMSIKASGAVVADRFGAISDQRTKVVRGRSNSTEDLQTLLRVEITDYTFKDKIRKGDEAQKKVIAQQVEEVYPLAVSKSIGVIPDIYQLAPIEDGWIELTSDLKVGDRVRLITQQEELSEEVLEVSDGKFRTGFTTERSDVFVYGREVDDFRTVDYQAIAMLNVSATQELHRQLQAKENTIALLERRLAALEARDMQRDEKLAKIEKLLESPKTVAVPEQISLVGLEGGAGK